MKQFTLDDIRAAAEKKYGTTGIDLGDGKQVELLNLLRLPKEKRQEVIDLQKAVSSEDKDEENAPSIDERTETILSILKTVAKTEAHGKMLEDALGGDLAMTLVVFEKYMEDTEAGEASGSQD